MKRSNWKILAVVLGVGAMAGTVRADITSIGITFGDGSQGPLSGTVGPGVAQDASTWNIVNAKAMSNGIDTLWDNTGLSWPNASNRGSNTYNGDWTGTLGAMVSDGTTLGTAMTLHVVDPGQPLAWSRNGGYGGARVPGIKPPTPPSYDEQYFMWGTALHSDGGLPTFTFNNIPYTTYDVYVAGTLLTHAGTTISDTGTVFSDQSGSSFQFSAPNGTAYTGYPGVPSMSYIQFVEVSELTTLVWQDALADDWTAINWMPDSGSTLVAPVGGEAMVVNSGIVTVSTDVTAAVADSLSIARNAADGTVEIAAAGTLAVTGGVNVGDGGTLGVSGELLLGGLNVDAGGTLVLGAGAMVRSPAARPPGHDVTITVDGTLRVGGGGNPSVGDWGEGGDGSSTHLTLRETATYEWSFTKSDTADELWDDDALVVVGTVNLADGLTIQLVDGGGSSADIDGGVDVILFSALNGAVFDPSKITVLPPDGLDWTWDTLIDGEGHKYPDLQFSSNNLVLKGLVTGAHPGDANDDKIVDAADLVLFDQQFGGTPGTTGVDNCDFDGDGDVDIDDFKILKDEWGWQLAGAPDAGPGASSATPEPATITLLGLGCLALIRRRRR